MERRIQERRKEYKKNFEDPRRKREDFQLQIRKEKREQNFQKKRIQAVIEGGSGEFVGVEGGAAGVANSFGSIGGNDANKASGAFGGGVGNVLSNIAAGVGVNNANATASGSIQIGNLEQMVAGVMSGDPKKELECTQQFRRLLSIEQNPPIQDVINGGVVHKFVEFLSCDDRPDLQFEAAWALTNIASGTHEQTQVVINHDAVPIFVRLLNSSKDDVREQAVWALGNIAGDSPECRNLVLECGGLPPLLEQLRQNQKFSMLRNATWTLSNLCRGKPPPPFEWVSPCLPTLAHLIYSADVEVLTDACWGLSYLSDGPNDRIQAVIDAGACKRLVDLLIHPSPLVQTPALRTVGNIVTGDDHQTQVIIQCEAIPNLLTLLSSPKRGIRKEACWTISNITAGNREQIQAVIDNNVIPALVELIKNHNNEFDIKREGAWAICNAMSGGNAQQIEQLVEFGCVKPLCEILDVDDTKMIIVALEAIENMLKAGVQKQKDTRGSENPYCAHIELADGVSMIEKLQDNSSEEIYQKAFKIIYTYFPYEEEEGIDEQKNDEGFSFGGAAPQQGFDFKGP